MIDIHVLTYSGTQERWLDECLESLTRENCTVHIVSGVEGNVGAGRAHAYTLGRHEFVGYVDSDDYVLPGVMDVCLDWLGRHRNVVTRERRLWGTMFDSSHMGMHHLTVYRRDDIGEILHLLPEHPLHCDTVAVKLMAPKQVPFDGYVWRMHAGQGHRRCTKEQDERARDACSK